jgi:hypothetical protein
MADRKPLHPEQQGSVPMSPEFKRGLDEAELQEQADTLWQMARPCIDILMSKGVVHAGCSKFGGSPDLPVDFVWPHHEHGPCRFIAQFRLADLSGIPGASSLPATGVLAFFQAHDENDRTFWQQPDYVRVFCFSEQTPLLPQEPPSGVRLGASCVVQFRAGLDVPRWPDTREARSMWPLDEELEDQYTEFRHALRESPHYLLGFPYNGTLCYDPTPGPDWCSLLTLSSDDELGWLWHDGDSLVTFIELHRLQRADFSVIASDAG